MNIVGIDIGGTFTDLVGCIDGRIVTSKTSTVPADPTRGVADSLTLAHCRMPALDEVLHGSTIAINTVLELVPAAHKRDMGGCSFFGFHESGSRFLLMHTFGGSFGDPNERAPDAVARDLAEGAVAPEAAESDYGAIPKAPHGYNIDGTQSSSGMLGASPPPQAGEGARPVRGWIGGSLCAINHSLP